MSMRYPVTCFLIDNDAEDQEIFCLALQEVDETICCTFADNGLAALEKLRADVAFLPSCIFIDLNMPLMNGLQCLAEIKKIERLHHTPVYIYSTAADPQSMQQALHTGATEFLVKPASFRQLVELLSGVFQTDVNLQHE